MPLHIGFIERAHIFYIVAVIPEVLHCVHKEACKIVELVVAQVNSRIIARQCRAAPGHEIWSRICKEEKIIHTPFPCCIHEPLLPRLLCKVIPAIGRKETLGPVPCTRNLVVLPVLVAAGTYVHSPVAQCHSHWIAILVELTLEKQVGNMLLLLPGPIFTHKIHTPGIGCTEIVYLLIFDTFINDIDSCFLSL